ncbi:MAG TPA: hypothetical protein VNA19_00370 [Pyrinomonadaceae bacterium]|nr:hypothetical protein [Pyrinomonadaceae bacterium]
MNTNDLQACIDEATDVARKRGYSNNNPSASTLLFFTHSQLSAFNIWAQKQGDGTHLYSGGIICAITIKVATANVEVISNAEIKCGISKGEVNHLSDVQVGQGGAVQQVAVNKKTTFNYSDSD